MDFIACPDDSVRESLCSAKSLPGPSACRTSETGRYTLYRLLESGVLLLRRSRLLRKPMSKVLGKSYPCALAVVQGRSY